MSVSSLTFTACSSLGISDGSLDYKNQQQLPKLNMAGESDTTIRPLLNLPAKTSSAVNFTNKDNTRFEMPKASN